MARSARTMRSVSGFVFKIQANMDPLHRDRVAFLRVCSGRFRARHAGLPPRLWQKDPPDAAAQAVRPGP